VGFNAFRRVNQKSDDFRQHDISACVVVFRRIVFLGGNLECPFSAVISAA